MSTFTEMVAAQASKACPHCGAGLKLKRASDYVLECTNGHRMTSPEECPSKAKARAKVEEGQRDGR